MTIDLTQLPDWLPEFERLDSYFGEFDRTWAPDFKMMPDILVIHSAALANWPAEYLANPICEDGKGHKCSDGNYRTIAAAHFCFYQGLPQKLRSGTVPPINSMKFVQMASLRHSAPHVGGSVCCGDFHPNRRSYGIELPAKLNVHDLFQELLNVLLPAIPSLDKWTTHSEIDMHKRDPVKGSGFERSWMDGRGLKFVGKEVI